MKVLASDKIAEIGLKMLKNAGIDAEMKTGLPEAELIKIIPEYDALVVRSATKVTPKIIEAGKKLTQENIKKYSTLHPRCGTSFIFIVLFVAILVFSIVKIDINFWLLLLLRIPLILPIAGISYEILKLSDRFKTNAIFNSLSKPGLWLQRITTRQPTKKQIEVAIAAVNNILKLEKKKVKFRKVFK